MPQSIVGFSKFKVLQFLYYIASLKGLSKDEAKFQIDNLIDDLSLDDFLSKTMGSLSGGMRQRVLFAQAIIGNPKILILDEPTAGLDPFERIRLRNIISKYAKDKVVIIATHVMQDVEAIAQYILFIKSGEILFNGTVKSCLTSFNVSEIDIEHDELDAFQKSNRISRLYQLENGYRVRYISKNANLKPDLDDAYLYYLVDDYD